MKSYIFTILVFSILLAGCSSKSLRKQRKLYKKATTGIKYKGYKTASKFVMAESMTKYNKQQPDSQQINTSYAHLLLGYFWTVSERWSFAFAEPEIVEEKNDVNNDSHARSLAQSLRVITMYQAGWHKLAALEATKVSLKVSSDQGSGRKYEAAVIYLLMGTLYIKEKDFNKALPFLAGFSAETGIRWPHQICDAAAEFQFGNVQQGLSKIKIVSQDPTVPKPIRDELALELAKLETQAGSPVNSSLFWPSVIGKIIWQEFRSSSNPAFNEFAKFVEDVAAKL